MALFEYVAPKLTYRYQYFESHGVQLRCLTNDEAMQSSEPLFGVKWQCMFVCTQAFLGELRQNLLIRKLF